MKVFSMSFSITTTREHRNATRKWRERRQYVIVIGAYHGAILDHHQEEQAILWYMTCNSLDNKWSSFLLSIEATSQINFLLFLPPLPPPLFRYPHPHFFSFLSKTPPIP
ncbi:unnamed protein product [Linum trigynum]|uniref:Uncharacterized protein n=1 Tax=Linum trigynum TaxID=586398 RepID=A0AAV2F7W7_9ROSI